MHRNSKRHDCSLSRYFYLIQLLFTFNQWYSTSKDFRREIVPENRRIFQNNVICFNNQRLFEGITQLVDDDIFLFAVFIGFFCPVVMQVLSDFILQLVWNVFVVHVVLDRLKVNFDFFLVASEVLNQSTDFIHRISETPHANVIVPMHKPISVFVTYFQKYNFF